MKLEGSSHVSQFILEEAWATMKASHSFFLLKLMGFLGNSQGFIFSITI